MPKVVTLQQDGYEVDVVVDESSSDLGATEASLASEALERATVVAKRSLSDAVSVMGQLACAFTKTLAAAEPKPNEVQLEFGLEAAGEAGNFVVSKLSGKSNFVVKMTWKFERAQ